MQRFPSSGSLKMGKTKIWWWNWNGKRTRCRCLRLGHKSKSSWLFKSQLVCITTSWVAAGLNPLFPLLTIFFSKNYQNFRTDDELIAYTETVQKTKKFPVLGKNSVIKFISKAQVKRISLAGNSISSVSLIENLASIVKNTLLEISFA